MKNLSLHQETSKDIKSRQNPTFYGYKIRQKHGHFTQVYTHKQVIINIRLDIIYIVRQMAISQNTLN